MTIPSDEIWRGGVTPRPTGESRWRFDGAPELRAMTDRGRPLLLAGFAVNSHARAVDDLLRAADLLATRYGFDVRRDLPVRDEMMALLANTPHVYGGGWFEVRTVLIDLRSVGVVGTLTVRSSSRTRGAESKGSPSHVAWLDRLMREIQPLPAGLLATRMDRIARSLDEAALLLTGMCDLVSSAGEVWAATGDAGRWPLPGEVGLDGVNALLLTGLTCHSQREMESRLRAQRAAATRRGRTS